MFHSKFLFATLGIVLLFLACDGGGITSGRRGTLARFLMVFQADMQEPGFETITGDCTTLCPDFKACAESVCDLTLDPLSCPLLCDDAPELTYPACPEIEAETARNPALCQILEQEPEPDIGVRHTPAEENPDFPETPDPVSAYNCCLVLQCLALGNSERDCELEICGTCDCDFRAMPNPCADF